MGVKEREKGPCVRGTDCLSRTVEPSGVSSAQLAACLLHAIERRDVAERMHVWRRRPCVHQQWLHVCSCHALAGCRAVPAVVAVSMSSSNDSRARATGSGAYSGAGCMALAWPHHRHGPHRQRRAGLGVGLTLCSAKQSGLRKRLKRSGSSKCSGARGKFSCIQQCFCLDQCWRATEGAGRSVVPGWARGKRRGGPA